MSFIPCSLQFGVSSPDQRLFYSVSDFLSPYILSLDVCWMKVVLPMLSFSGAVMVKVSVSKKGRTPMEEVGFFQDVSFLGGENLQRGHQNLEERTPASSHYSLGFSLLGLNTDLNQFKHQHVKAVIFPLFPTQGTEISDTSEETAKLETRIWSLKVYCTLRTLLCCYLRGTGHSSVIFLFSLSFIIHPLRKM